MAEGGCFAEQVLRGSCRLWRTADLAWGSEGHRIAAHIAARESPAARTAVASLLGDSDVPSVINRALRVTASNWGRAAQGDPQVHGRALDYTARGVRCALTPLADAAPLV